MTYKKAAIRVEEIVAAGLVLAVAKGYQQVSRADLAQAVGVAESLVSAKFGTMPQFRRALMRAAVHQRNAAVVAQGLAMRDQEAGKADDALRNAAASFLKA
jgi:AcrR family transcriptional regulator